MDKHVLVKDSKYEGGYVAFTSVTNHTVIAYGSKPEDVMRKAKEAGASHPMIFFVPEKNMTCCY
ncbi:MAG: DUF5678 domain-containing protein [Phycisphaerae bacterium]|nr:DUF5678 domain-containing protein [Phycisphaerae bacterium]